jgi:hypothetical protein
VTGTIAPDPDGAGAAALPRGAQRYDPAGRLIQVEQGWLAAWQSESVAPAAGRASTRSGGRHRI